jgi:hypothetical protein
MQFFGQSSSANRRRTKVYFSASSKSMETLHSNPGWQQALYIIHYATIFLNMIYFSFQMACKKEKKVQLICHEINL